jgi:hypothetical protein
MGTARQTFDAPPIWAARPEPRCDERQPESKEHRMQCLRVVLGLVAVIAAGSVAGCGGSGEPSSSVQKPPVSKPSHPVSQDERGILATVDALQTASRKGDGRTVCGDLFTAPLVRSIEASTTRSCAKEVHEHLFAPDSTISVGKDIKVTADRATAVISESSGNVSTLFLVKRDAQWRIYRVTPLTSG